MHGILVYFVNYNIRITVKGTVQWKQFFGVLSENMLSNLMPPKGLTAFSTLLASSFNWGAPCKSEVTTMGFISKIAVFLRR